GPRPPCDSRAGATSTPPAGSSRPRPPSADGALPGSGRLRRREARLARAQQPVAQVGLIVGRRVPCRRVGQVVERGEAEELEEQRRRAVKAGAELRAARLLD